jgi:hypothetical protein
MDKKKKDGRSKNRGFKGLAGRKKLEDKDKKAPITVYILKSKIDAMGGADIARKVAKSVLE